MPEPDLPLLPSTRALISARTEFLAGHYSTHALTLSWNDWPVPLAHVRATLRHLHACVDRRLLGPRYHRHPEHERSAFVAAVEGLDHHVHAHLAWHVPDALVRDFEHLFTGRRSSLWSSLAPAGTHELKPISDTGWIEYATKFLCGDATADHLILSTEFHRAH